MDPVSAVASIVSIIEALGWILEHIRALKEVSLECKRLSLEICLLRGLLQVLQDFVEIEDDPDWRQSVRQLEIPDGLFTQFQATLDRLREKIEPKKGFEQAARLLLWRSITREVRDALAHIARVKSVIEVALQVDHILLTREINAKIDILTTEAINLKKVSDRQAFDSLLQWLSPASHHGNLQQGLNLRHEGTCKWFLQHHIFKDWISGNIHTLFCPGRPGAGKSVIAATAVEHVERKISGKSKSVVYLHCDYTQQTTQTTSNLLSAMMRQLVQAAGRATSSIYDMRDRHESAMTRPSIVDLERALADLAHDFEVMFVVIDALDECERLTREDFVSSVRKLQSVCDVRLLATSRVVPEVIELFENEIQINVEASAEDVLEYALSRTAKCRAKAAREPQFAQQVAHGVGKSAEGIFLLARLYMDALTAQITLRDVKDTLAALPRGSVEQRYDASYEAAMERIETQAPQDSMLAKKVLEWVICAKRPLRAVELQHALAIRVGDQELHQEAIVDIDTILSVCAGLLSLIEEGADEDILSMRLGSKLAPRTTVHLVHFTTKEYFERTKCKYFPSADLSITKTCITYLSLDVFKTGRCEDAFMDQALFDEYPFLLYAAKYWGGHAKNFENSGVHDQFKDFLATIEQFLKDPDLMDFVSQVNHRSKGKLWAQTSLPSRGRNMFHYLAIEDLELSCRYFIEKNGYMGDPDANGVTPLHEAARSDCKSVLLALLDCQTAQVDAKDLRRWTALMSAAWHRNYSCVKLLLQSGRADVNARNCVGETPIFQVAMTGHIEIAALLLQRHDIEINIQNEYGKTPLAVSLQHGRVQIARQLLLSGKLNAAEVQIAERRIYELESVPLNRGDLVQLLLDASQAEAAWRHSKEYISLPMLASGRGFGTCWLIVELVRQCPTLGDEGGPACGTLCKCVDVRESCRAYIAQIGGWGDGQCKNTDDVWYHGLLDKLRPWLALKERLPDTTSLQSWLRLVEVRLGHIICDECNCITRHCYHCERCNDNNFDLCSGCVGHGLWCYDKTHELEECNAANDLGYSNVTFETANLLRSQSLTSLDSAIATL